MKRFLIGTCFLAGSMAIAAAPATGQLSANVQVSWHWSDDGWRSSGPVVDGYVHWTEARVGRIARFDRAPVRARVLPAGFRVPPGHMPPPGMCRAWLIGVPPGHQPPPQPCARLFRRHRGPDAVILHTPGRPDHRAWADRHGEWWDDDWDEDDWDEDDRWDDRGGKRGHDGARRRRGGRGGR